MHLKTLESHLMDHHQISLLILSEFKRVNLFPFPPEIEIEKFFGWFQGGIEVN